VSSCSSGYLKDPSGKQCNAISAVSINIGFTLTPDASTLADWKSQPTQFNVGVAANLADSLGFASNQVSVASRFNSDGSVTIAATILPDSSGTLPSASSVQDSLQAQLDNPNSPLLSASYTHHAAWNQTVPIPTTATVYNCDPNGSGGFSASCSTSSASSKAWVAGVIIGLIVAAGLAYVGYLYYKKVQKGKKAADFESTSADADGVPHTNGVTQMISISPPITPPAAANEHPAVVLSAVSPKGPVSPTAVTPLMGEHAAVV